MASAQETDVETDAQPASLLPNTNSQSEASGYDDSKNQQHPEGEELIDVTVVYAKEDYERAVAFIEWLFSLLPLDMSDARIRLYDDECFCPDKVKNVENFVSRTMLAFMFLTEEFVKNTELEFVNSEALGQTRLAEGIDLRRFANMFLEKNKYAVRPVHTEKSKGRSYRTPSGLHSLRSIDYYDKDSKHTKDKTKKLLIEAINKRRRQETDLHRNNYELGSSDRNVYQGAPASEQPLKPSKQNIYNSNTGSSQSGSEAKTTLSNQNSVITEESNEADMSRNPSDVNLTSTSHRDISNPNSVFNNSSQNDNHSVADSDYCSENAASRINAESTSAGLLSNNAESQSILDNVTTYSLPQIRNSTAGTSCNSISSTESRKPLCYPEDEDHINSLGRSEGFSYSKSASASDSNVSSSSSNTASTDSSAENNTLNDIQQNANTLQQSRGHRHPQSSLNEDAPSTSGDVGDEVIENTVRTEGQGHSKKRGYMAGADHRDYPYPLPPHAQQANQTTKPVQNSILPENSRFTHGQMPRQADPSHGQGHPPPYSYRDLPSYDSLQEDGGSLYPEGHAYRQPPQPRYYEREGLPYQPPPTRYYEGVERVTHIHYHYNEPPENRRPTRETTDSPPAGPQYNIVGCNVVQIGSDNAVQQSGNAGQINDQVNVIPGTDSEGRDTSETAHSNENDDNDNTEFYDDDDDDDDDEDHGETNRQLVGDSWNNLSEDQYPSNSLQDKNSFTESVREQLGDHQEDEEVSDEDNDFNDKDEQFVRKQQNTEGHITREEQMLEEEESDKDNKTNDGMSDFLDKHLNDSGNLELASTVYTNVRVEFNERSIVAPSNYETSETPVSEVQSTEIFSACQTSQFVDFSSISASIPSEQTTPLDVTVTVSSSEEVTIDNLEQTLNEELNLGATAQVLSGENSRNQDGDNGNLSQLRLNQIGALFHVQRVYVPGGRVKREIKTCPPCKKEKDENIHHDHDDDDLD